MHERPFLVVRERPAGRRPHPYDVVLDWVAENFPDHLPLFRLAALPLDLGETDFGLHVAWLNDPVQAYSMELYEQATRLAAACDARGIPVINRVDRLINATKSIGAGLIAEAGVRVPRMARIASAEEFHDTLCGIPLPLILRDDWGHQGELLRADTLEEARALPLDRFARPIAVELVDIRDRRDGYFRKYRYFAIGEAGVSSHLQLSREWITRGQSRVSGDNARGEELDYIGRPDPNHLVLQHARRALGLDYVAFDYGYDQEGQVVVWEANPYPYLHFSTQSLVYRNASMHRTIAGLLKLYLDRGGIPSPERLDALLDYSRAPSTTFNRAVAMPVALMDTVASPRLRCLGEFPVAVEAGDSLMLTLALAGKASLRVFSRTEDGRATLIPLRWDSAGDHASASLLTDAVGPLLLTLVADEAVASEIASTTVLVHQASGMAAKRFDGSVARRSKLYLAPVVLAKGPRVDHFRIRSTLGSVTRFCLAAVSLGANAIDGGTFSPVIHSAYRYVDVFAGATLIPSPFSAAAGCVFFLIPWSAGDRSAQVAAITGFEALQVSRIVGEAPPAEADPEQAPGAPSAGDERQTLWALDQAQEAHVAQLLDIARRTTSAEIRQDVADRLIGMDRCPDSLISRSGVSARAASSFHRALLTWSRKAELQPSSLGLDKALEWLVKDKDHGYRLAGLLGARRLARHGPLAATEALSHAAQATRPVVLKPVGAAGSWGVYVVHAPDSILDLRQRRWVANLDGLAAEMARLTWDRWLVEDFAAEPDDPLRPAADLKFYCFYGKVGIVVEIERYPMTRYAWWLRDGTPTFTGHYPNQLFMGRGFTPEQLEAVEHLSAQLPFPFMRIDLLRGKDGLFFGEFTPRPGDFEVFLPALDALLGDLFLDAELRLMRDLLLGRTFPAFVDWATPFLQRGPGPS